MNRKALIKGLTITDVGQRLAKMLSKQAITKCINIVQKQYETPSMIKYREFSMKKYKNRRKKIT